MSDEPYETAHPKGDQNPFGMVYSRPDGQSRLHSELQPHFVMRRPPIRSRPELLP